MEHVASPERRAKLAIVPPHPLDEAFRRTGQAPQPIDVLRHCAETAGEFALLVFPTHAIARREIERTTECSFVHEHVSHYADFRVSFVNGSEARFVGADERINVLGREFSLLWLHADVDESVAEGVRVRPRDAATGGSAAPGAYGSSTRLAGIPVPCPPTPHYRCPKCRAATCFAPGGPPAATLAESRWRCDVCRQVSAGAELIPLATVAPMDEREEWRLEIEAVLREDARLHPDFAEARRGAVLAAVEAWERVKDGKPYPKINASALVGDLRHYERARGGLASPAADAGRGISHNALAAYECARTRRPAPSAALAHDLGARAKAIRAAFPAEQSLAEAFGASHTERGRWRAEAPPEEPIGTALHGAAKGETLTVALFP